MVIGVIVANFGRKREPGRDGQADVGHFGQIRAFAAEQILHIGAAFRLAGTKEIDVLTHEETFPS